MSQNYLKTKLKNDHNFISPLIDPLNEATFTSHSSSYLYQCALITQRNFIVNLRIPQVSWVKLIIISFIALLVSSMFPHLNKDKDFTGARNRNGVLFFISAASGFIAAQFVILVFPHERPIFLREIGSNMYSVGPYFLGRYIAEIPGAIIAPVLFGSIIYPIVGLNTVYAWKFPLFRKNNHLNNEFLYIVAILIMTYNTAASASLVMSAAFKRKESAVTLAPLFLLTS